LVNGLAANVATVGGGYNSQRHECEQEDDYYWHHRKFPAEMVYRHSLTSIAVRRHLGESAHVPNECTNQSHHATRNARANWEAYGWRVFWYERIVANNT
jgi:hypothetical protein